MIVLTLITVLILAIVYRLTKPQKIPILELSNDKVEPDRPLSNVTKTEITAKSSIDQPKSQRQKD